MRTFLLSFLLIICSLGIGCSNKAKPASVPASSSKSEAKSEPAKPLAYNASNPVRGDAKSSSKATSFPKAPKPKPKKTLPFLRPPRLADVPIPDFPGAHAIWGATGRDHLGRIYFGVASYGVDDPSARLMRLDPRSMKVDDVGRVNTKLDELGVRRIDPYPETQMKIHSKIVQAADGRMYFSSQDEHDEAGDGSKNALFGGRLFALDLQDDRWDCVLTAPEGLIAVACHHRYVWTMGYFGHVLYRYDTQTKEVRSVKLGTFGGHVSRNVFVDTREHAYAVRLVEYSGAESTGVYELLGKRVRATLVEIDPEMRELGEWPLEDYQPSAGTDSHGLTAFSYLADGSIVFVTHSGAIWILVAGKDEASLKLERLGWFHPKGSTYVASLFCPTGAEYVMGFANSSKGGYDWVYYDLANRRSTVLRLNETANRLLNQKDLLIYGSETMDDDFRAYVVGWRKIERGYGPHVLQLDWNYPEY